MIELNALSNTPVSLADKERLQIVQKTVLGEQAGRAEKAKPAPAAVSIWINAQLIRDGRWGWIAEGFTPDAVKHQTLLDYFARLSAFAGSLRSNGPSNRSSSSRKLAMISITVVTS